MRIFVGSIEIAGQIPLLAAGFRALGHTVTTGVYSKSSYKFDESLTYDVDINPQDHAQAAHIINQHDVFLFQFGASLLRDNADFRMIRRAKKRIISLFNGSEVRYWPAYEQQFGINFLALTGDNPPDYWGPHKLPHVLGNLRRGELYADLVLSVPNQSVLGLRPYDHFFYPAEIGRYTFHVPGRDVPVVVHAPSRTQTKGTPLILAALDSLRAQGVAFELRLLQNVPNAEVLAALTDADCIIDQVYLGFGLFAVEGMASGCAAATGHFPHLEAFAANRPIHPLHPGTLEASLRELLTHRELRVRLAYEGRAHAETWHDHIRVCQRILGALEEGEKHQHDYWPRYCATEAVLPEGVFLYPEYLSMSDAIVQKHGLPHDADAQDMVRRGWLSPAVMDHALPRWSSLVQDWGKRSGLPKMLSVEKAESPDMLPLPDLLPNKQITSLFTMCLREALPLRDASPLNKMLRTGLQGTALQQLYNLVLAMPTPTPSLVAALGFLLWGCGLLEAARKTLCSPSVFGPMPHKSDGSTAPEEPWQLLVRWICGCDVLSTGNMRTALPVLLSVLQAMPPASKGSICLLPVFAPQQTADTIQTPTIVQTQAIRDVEDGADAVISWERPQNVPSDCDWFSPAVFAPDWCSQCRSGAIEIFLPFQLRSAGYAVRVAGQDDRFWHTLDTVLQTSASQR